MRDAPAASRTRARIRANRWRSSRTFVVKNLRFGRSNDVTTTSASGILNTRRMSARASGVALPVSDGRRTAKQRPKHAQAAIDGAEFVAPLTDAVRFVDREEGQPCVGGAEPSSEGGESLRRAIQQRQPAVDARVELAVHVCCRNSSP